MKIIKKSKLIFILLICVLFVSTGAQCGTPQGLTIGAPEPVTLTYWRVFDESSNIAPLISEYKRRQPHVNIQYKNFTFDEFEENLLNALAIDRGPDIFSIHTNWMNDYTDKILPMPAQVTLQNKIIRGTVKKETYTEEKVENTLSFKSFRELYPEVVFTNQYKNEQILGLPLSIDTLALFYNRDLLNAAGIVEPPKTWDEFKTQIIKLTRLSSQGDIIQSGAALGTASNVERAADIVSLIMMQNGVQMTTSSGRANFAAGLSKKRPTTSASDALTFYNNFAMPEKETFTWNEQMDNSLTAFESGQTAFFIGYSYHIPMIKSHSPRLNFGISSMPQISNPINFASYWVETVSNKTAYPDEAWDFILYTTTRDTINTKYLAASKKPPALKSLIASQADDIELSAFGSQILTAQTWYQGRDAIQADQFFNNMIDENLTGTTETYILMVDAQNKINQTY